MTHVPNRLGDREKSDGRKRTSRFACEAKRSMERTRDDVRAKTKARLNVRA
jgi:hypothetical protein